MLRKSAGVIQLLPSHSLAMRAQAGGIDFKGDQEARTQGILWRFALDHLVRTAKGTGVCQAIQRYGGLSAAVLAGHLFARFAPALGGALHGIDGEFELVGAFADHGFLGRFVISAVGAGQTAIRSAISCGCAALRAFEVDHFLVGAAVGRCRHVHFDAANR